MGLLEATEMTLDHAMDFISKSPWRTEYLIRVERLKERIHAPCVLAVAGRVKAGKSTLINSLLGQNLALVGATETTATINYFRHGTPDDPLRPVCCVWANGRSTWETLEFVDSLQGTDDGALRRAEALAYLEYYLPHPDLKTVTLVDTPGTDALAGEDGHAHERVAGGFFGTTAPEGIGNAGDRSKLRSRHAEETRQISESADAVIYLVGQVAHVSNESFLSEFHNASSGQTRALNAIGVMSKVDIQDEIIEQRHELAASIAQHLSKELNTVVPVSAALWQTVCELERQPERLRQIKESLARIPQDRFVRMLSSERAFLREYDDCPIPVEERQAMASSMPWRVLVLLARELRARESEEAVRNLRDISGFQELRRLIQDHFFKRSRLLRCFRIVSELKEILDEIKRNRLYAYRRQIADAKKELIEFTDFIIAHPDGKSETANRLRRYLEKHLPEDESQRLETAVAEFSDHLEEVLDQLEIINRQFYGLQLLEQAGANMFTGDEIRELQNLFGLYAQGLTAGKTREKGEDAKRQLYWRQSATQSRDALRRKVADLAVHFYGQKLASAQ